ncbi:MAG: sulfotransferase domain-containing protein [bacterium]
MDKDTITVVSGLPRSGTSMMMKMLEAGGMELLTDNQRTADEDNPKGYYEFEKVKELDKEHSWLASSQGKVVKIISALLEKLPRDYSYKILFMQRNIQEILASQKQMLVRRGEPTDTISDEKMAEHFSRHLKRVETWLEQQPNIDVTYVHYNEVLKNPADSIKKINAFLDHSLDEQNMAKVVDQALYRQRK